MTPEQQVVFRKSTIRTAQNISPLLTQEGESVAIYVDGQEIILKKRSLKKIMFGLHEDIRGLGFDPKSTSAMLSPTSKNTFLGLKKV
jgi:hypothetical protein